MRWDSLFDDLESQLEWERSADDVELEAEEERLRLGRLGLRERLLALSQDADNRLGAQPLRVRLRSGRDITVRAKTFGRDWIAADLVRAHGAAGSCILPLSSISAVSVRPGQATSSLAEPPPHERGPQITDRIGLPFVLRDICRRRGYVSISDATGTVGGTIDRVARDHLDIAVHPRGTARRAREVSHVQLIVLAGIELVEL